MHHIIKANWNVSQVLNLREIYRSSTHFSRPGIIWTWRVLVDSIHTSRDLELYRDMPGIESFVVKYWYDIESNPRTSHRRALKICVRSIIVFIICFFLALIFEIIMWIFRLKVQRVSRVHISSTLVVACGCLGCHRHAPHPKTMRNRVVGKVKTTTGDYGWWCTPEYPKHAHDATWNVTPSYRHTLNSNPTIHFLISNIDARNKLNIWERRISWQNFMIIGSVGSQRASSQKVNILQKVDKNNFKKIGEKDVEKECKKMPTMVWWG